MSYEDFIARKRLAVPDAGFEAPSALNAALFPFQAHIVRWALRKGRCAIFAECGLGKTLQQLEWARLVAEHTNGRVLIFAPLAVAQQTVREAQRFGISASYAATQMSAPESPVLVTNYERLKHFDVGSFAGVVLDESSILKAFAGKTKRALVESCASVPYRLACTATPAPNDHLELGNHAEWLGVMSSHDMIARWFVNDAATFGTYRLKGHAVESFWDWVASWAVCVARPSDLGFSDDGYVLPELRLRPHVLDVDLLEDRGDTLFRIPDMSATSIHREKRRTAGARAAAVAEVVLAEPGESWIVWCDTDYEAKELVTRIPDGVEIRGSHSVQRKEQAALDFVDGATRVLISKPSIFGWGLNFQSCARMAFVGVGFSYELFYQAIRRAWRFGQRRPVDVHVVMASTETSVWSVLSVKRDGHDEMRAQMSAAMRRAQARESPTDGYRPTVEMQIPEWLRSERRAA